MSNKNELYYAVEYISNHKKPSKFLDIAFYVKTKLELTDDEYDDMIGELYTELTMEPTVYNVGDNKWDLKERHTSDETFFEIPEDDETENNQDDYDSDDMGDQLDYSGFGSNDNDDDNVTPNSNNNDNESESDDNDL